MSNSITITDLKLPSGVEVKEMKTAISFTRGSKKAYLKGRSLEITNPIKDLGSRVKLYSKEIIAKCHLGNVQGVIPAVADVIDLGKILNKYFKSAAKKA
jgi:hypothetical protein